MAAQCDRDTRPTGGCHQLAASQCCCLSTCCNSSFLIAVLAVRCSAFRMICSSFLCHWGIAVLDTTCKTICSVRTLKCTPRHKVLILWEVRLENGPFPDPALTHMVRAASHCAEQLSLCSWPSAAQPPGHWQKSCCQRGNSR